MRYTVFLGAPSPSSTHSNRDDGIFYQWRRLATSTNTVSKDTSVDSFSGYPSSALDGASRRISAIYENIIFADEDEDEGDTQAVEEDLMDDEQGSEAQLSPLSSLKLICDDGLLRPDDPGDMGHNDPTRTRKRLCEQGCDAHFDTLARRVFIMAE